MADGSSSAAPVIRPRPMARRAPPLGADGDSAAEGRAACWETDIVRCRALERPDTAGGWVLRSSNPVPPPTRCSLCEAYAGVASYRLVAVSLRERRHPRGSPLTRAADAMGVGT